MIRQIPPLLIERLRRGDEGAFKSIYDTLHKQVYALIFSIIKNQEQSEDILQETFISLWVNKEKLTAVQPLVPYIYLTARRLTIDTFRKNASESHFKENLTFRLSEMSTNTEDKIVADDMQAYTNTIVNTLPLQQQMVFRLSRQEDLSYDEIAERLHISRNTVRNHLVCALKTLRSALTKHVISFLLFFLAI
jgi:RNA polymerase sigma-70 factor (family 1)